MPELYENPIVRIVLVGIPLLIASFKSHSINDWFVYGFISISIGSELATLYKPDNNIFLLSILGILQTACVVTMISVDTKNYKVAIFILPSIIVFITYVSSDFSFLQRFYETPIFEGVKPVSVQQFFDLFTIFNFTLIILFFYWLNYSIEHYHTTSGLFYKRLIYIFAFLLFYTGTFYTIAFGRLLLPNLSKWFQIWRVIYFPIHFIFYITISLNLLWKPQQSS